MKRSKTAPKQRYLHQKAIKALQTEVGAVACIAGRGWSKSTIAGADIYANAVAMPGSLGSIWGLTYNQILTKVLPSAKKELMAIGLIQDRPGQPGHFIVGHKPPPYFKRPINEPLKWENVITFFNGTAVELISVDRPETIAGGSYDWMIFDEAVYFPKDVHDTKSIPSLRGNVQFFGDCHRHGRRLYLSSQAWDPAGYWVEDQKWLKDENGDLALDKDGERILDPNFLFIHGTSYDNVEILTKKTLALWRQTLPKLVFDVEIMAKRMEKLSDAFYDCFDPKIHTYYRAFEYSYNYEQNEFGIAVQKKDLDRNSKLPLMLSFDFGTNFNSLLVAQFHHKLNELRFINEFFESSNKLISNLVDPFCKAYENHTNKQVELFGDPAGNRVAHMENANLFEKVANYLRSKGWTVINRMSGKAYPLHKVRHQFINEVLAETNRKLARIRINVHRCKYLLTSIRNAPLTKNQKKRKTSERQNIPQETATHLSDAFDYITYYFLYPRARSSGSSESIGGGARFGKRA